MKYFRQQRYKMFKKRLHPITSYPILDVGGLPYDWIAWNYPGPVYCVSLSNIREGRWGNGNIIYMKQDATRLPYADNTFQIAYSNSLLEHVGRENQTKVANEISRVSRNYWVQVPNRNFVIEPHYRAPFFYYLPPAIRRWVATYWTPLIRKTNYYLSELDTIHLLDRNEMSELFPNAEIIPEKVGGLNKSWIALHNSKAD